MPETKVTAAGAYLVQCRLCGAWVEVQPENSTDPAQPFFEVLLADFCCCGLRQSATFIREKDALDFH